jgi:hypothetical protein
MQTPKSLTTKNEKIFMRIFVISICSLALVFSAYAAQPDEGKPQKRKQAHTVQQGTPPKGHPTGAGASGKKTSTGGYEAKKGQTSVETYGGHKGKKGQTSKEAYEGQTGKAAKGGKVTEATGATGTAATGKLVKPQHFDLRKQPNTAKAPAVTFQQGRHIEGSEHWQGQQYAAFRNYHAEWHDEGWWHNHYHNNIVFVFGAPYFFNAGYWFPAWGYYPNAYYAWDGPIYAYNHLPPDQVIANVQTTLQQQGYYHGDVDGLIGPLTRSALADYQRDHGLYETAAIDQPTLESLGMT